MKATVTSKGQITIPLAIRRRLKLNTGTILEFDEAADYLKAVKCVDPERMRSAIGLGKSELAGQSASAWLDELRGPVELPPGKRGR
jgi:AbrB family looped-hinge helix DNA binding protein